MHYAKKIIVLLLSLFITVSYADPVIITNPADVFPAVANPKLPNPDAAWGVIKKPYPTEAWYANLTIKGENDDEAGLQPIRPAPYAVKSGPQGMAFGIPQVSFANEDDTP